MRHIQRSTTLLALGLALLLAPAAAGAQGGNPRIFFSPEAAAQALVAATRAGDDKSMLELFGQDSADLIEPDPAFAAQKRAKFTAAAEERVLLRRDGDDRMTMVVGYDAWPVPVPIVREGDTWYFDADAGRDELINRVIGANELNAIAVLRAYVDAQKQYARKDRNGDGVREFAQRLLSSPGKQDGLYWEGGDEESPFGPLIAAGPTPVAGSSYRGYKFRILKAQGPQAPGGPYSYVINGRMLAGYALLAYPTQYGRTGVMSFIVNQYGIVYQRDLGPKTAEVAGAMNAYNPAKGWVPVD